MLDGDGRSGEAADVRLIIIDLEPDTANRLDLAASYMAAGDAGPALEVYRDVLAEDADNPDALEGAVAASVSLELSRVELEYRRRAISAATGDTAAHRFAVARLLLVDFGDYEEGLASLERALDAGFNDPERTGELLGAAPPTIRPAIRNLLTEYGR